MGEMKPIGSEKLQGDEKLKRILNLTYYQTENDKNKSTRGAEYISESECGVYGIVKEKDGYYVKKGLTENTLDYIGGLFMKNKNRFQSYAEALKRLELLEGQEVIEEATKYVLKSPKPNPVEATPPQPAMDAPAPAPAPMGEPTPDAGLDGMPTDTEPTDDTSLDSEPDNEMDPLKSIQKITGKLAEKIRDYETTSGTEFEGDDIKYVINSVLAAFGDNIFKMDSTDIDDIVSKFEDSEDTYDGESAGNDEIPGDETGTEELPAEMSEYDDIINRLESVVNTPFEDEEEEEYMGNDEECAGEFQDKDIEGYEDNLYRHHEKRRAGGNWPKEEEISLGEEAQEESSVKEIELDELTDLINRTVKETLTKYFN